MAKTKKVRRRRSPASPFTADEIQKLIAAASGWWEAFVRLTWESGQELADLAQLRWDQIAADGTVRMVRSKTGISVTFQLSSKAISAARALGDAGLVLPWNAAPPDSFPRAWRQFVASVDGVRPLSATHLRMAAVKRTASEQGVRAARRLLGHTPGEP